MATRPPRERRQSYSTVKRSPSRCWQCGIALLWLVVDLSPNSAFRVPRASNAPGAICHAAPSNSHAMMPSFAKPVRVRSLEIHPRDGKIGTWEAPETVRTSQGLAAQCPVCPVCPVPSTVLPFLQYLLRSLKSTGLAVMGQPRPRIPHLSSVTDDGVA